MPSDLAIEGGLAQTTGDGRYVLKAGDTSTGEQVAPDFKATGKTGATATPQLLAGGTTSGAPTTGAHVKGELVTDDTGVLWFCTVAGTPGTWVSTGSPLYALKTDPLSLGLIFTSDPVANAGGIAINVANRAAFIRLAEGSGAITKARIHVTVSSGNISGAAYDTTGAGLAALPNNRLGTTGAIPCPAAGAADLTLAATLPVGGWLALSSDNTTAKFVCSATNIFASTLWAGRAAYQDSAHPLPNPAAASAGLIGVPIIVGVP